MATRAIVTSELKSGAEPADYGVHSVKTIVEHPYYGTLIYDTATDKVTVQKGNLAERLTWLMHHREELGRGSDYYPNAFLRACELLGVCGGELDVEVRREGEHDLPEGAVY